MKFKLSSYDVIGIDFDNTLIQYNLTNLFQYHYKYLSEYLIKKKNYNGLSTSMSDEDVDFIRRGLFIDFKRGNILDISKDGLIITASHGCRRLNTDEIINAYGVEMRWSVTNQFIEDRLALWDGAASQQTRTFLDYTDIVGTLVFAKVIDLIDESLMYNNYENVWPHLLEAIVDMYKSNANYEKEILNNLPDYVYKCDRNIINWLTTIKQSSKVILITGSPPNWIKNIAEYSLGLNWKEYFDTIIYCSKKPAFFIGTNAFVDQSGQPIKLITSKGSYLRGNWVELQTLLEKEMQKSVRCVYLGDNTIQDIYAPTISKKPIDTIAIIEETEADGHFLGKQHPHQNYLTSNFWGPYFGRDNFRTIMADIIMKHSKLCLPSVMYLAENSLDYEYVPFWEISG